MPLLKVRLCPFNSEPIVMDKPISGDTPQIGSNLIEGDYRFRVALIELDLKTMITTVILSDFKAPKHPVEEMVEVLIKAGWKIVSAPADKKKKDD